MQRMFAVTFKGQYLLCKDACANKPDTFTNKALASQRRHLYASAKQDPNRAETARYKSQEIPKTQPRSSSLLVHLRVNGLFAPRLALASVVQRGMLE